MNENALVENINIEYNYFYLLALTIKQFNDSQKEKGAYFWVKKDANNENQYMIYYHDGKETKTDIRTIDDASMRVLIDILKNTGFEISTTENNSMLITITKENILKYNYKRKYSKIDSRKQ